MSKMQRTKNSFNDEMTLMKIFNHRKNRKGEMNFEVMYKIDG